MTRFRLAFALVVALITVPLAADSATQVFRAYDITYVDTDGTTKNALEVQFKSWEADGWTLVTQWPSYTTLNGVTYTQVNFLMRKGAAPVVATAPSQPSTPSELPLCASAVGAGGSGWVSVGAGWVPPNHPAAANGTCRAR